MMGEIETKRDTESIAERAKLRRVKTCWNCKHAAKNKGFGLECTRQERVNLRAGSWGVPEVLSSVVHSLYPDPCDICGLWEGFDGDWEDLENG